MEVILKFLWLAGCYGVGIGVAVVVHELGHAFASLLVTRQRIELQIGKRASDAKGWRVGRLQVFWSPRGFHLGATRYDRTAVSRVRQMAVAAAGPLASFVFFAFFAVLMSRSLLGGWQWISFLGLSVANFRILIVALWPVAYRPHGPEGEVWLSDGLDFWRLWRGR